MALQHLVDLRLQLADGALKPALFGGRILAEQLAGGDGRLMQHRDADGEAVGEALAAQSLRPLRGELDVLELGRVQQVAGRDHHGQHHGDYLQVIYLVLAVDPAGAVPARR